MISGFRLAAVASASAVVFSLSAGSAMAAGPCVSGAEVSGQVHTLVASLRDDVKSNAGRSALAHAMVDTLHTYRGVDATTALVEQRERGAFPAAERATIQGYLDALRHAVIAKTDTRAEGQAVSEAFKNLHTQMGC